MAQGVAPLDTTHRGPIHAVQLDHFGKRLATASEDRCVHVWDVVTRQFITELRGHDGPVWAVAWAHPMYGAMLASAGEDRCTVIWRQAEVGDWYEVHREKAQGPIMAIAFSPWEYGCQLAMASCDGHMYVLSFRAPIANPGTEAAPPERWLCRNFRA